MMTTVNTQSWWRLHTDWIVNNLKYPSFQNPPEPFDKVDGLKHQSPQ